MQEQQLDAEKARRIEEAVARIEARLAWLMDNPEVLRRHIHVERVERKDDEKSDML